MKLILSKVGAPTWAEAQQCARRGIRASLSAAMPRQQWDAGRTRRVVTQQDTNVSGGDP